ncbi:MAG: LPXTG cell wall anchor domain-containing protein [Deltaproteobacteria bacterium]|nr:LPXTG cell wall anchor domain-containing protein [Deltaproteobacteria bacterium]
MPVVVWGSGCSSTSGPILSGALLSLGVALGFRRRRR